METTHGSIIPPISPATLKMLSFFDYRHLPPFLQEVSQPLSELAKLMANTLPDGAERAVGLRKLLEAKDCFIRAALPV